MNMGSKEDFKLEGSWILRKLVQHDGTLFVTNAIIVYENGEGESSCEAKIRARFFSIYNTM